MTFVVTFDPRIFLRSNKTLRNLKKLRKIETISAIIAVIIAVKIVRKLPYWLFPKSILIKKMFLELFMLKSQEIRQ